MEALLGGPRRNAELAADVAGIAPNILADRLRRLEADGLIVATAYAERPPRFEYRLTAEGRSLAGAMRLLADWGARHADRGRRDQGSLRHEACGTALEARWFCPTCGESWTMSLGRPAADLTGRPTGARLHSARWTIRAGNRDAGARSGRPRRSDATVDSRDRPDPAPEALHQPVRDRPRRRRHRDHRARDRLDAVSPLVKVCILVGAPILIVTTADASLRIWRSAWAWMPVNRNRGLFRLAWLAAAAIGILVFVAARSWRSRHER